MKANDLLKYVNKAATVVNNGVLVPIAKNLLFTDNIIKATDLKSNIIVKTPFTFEGSTAVDTQKLVGLLKALKNQEITITFGSPTTIITSETGEYKISAFDGAEFPAIDPVKGDKVTKSYLLQRVVEVTKGSVSNDDLRPAMTGVYFDSDLGYTVSTNGHKLSRYQAKFEESFILPTHAFPLIKLLEDEDVTYGQSGNKISFRTDNLYFEVTKVEGNYPPYDRVIPKENDKTLTIEADALKDAVKRVALFSNSETGAIVLNMGEGVVVSGQDIDYGNSAEENVEGDFNAPAGLKIGFSAKYLTSLLNDLEGTLTITFSEANKPALITSSTNPRLLQLVMPVVI